MNILWVTWKDHTHPMAGGAEVVARELGQRLARDGHQLIFLTGGYKGATREASFDGYKVVRLGNRYTVYLQAAAYYRKHLRGWPDLIIEEVNTVPFFSKFYAREPKHLLFHQLCKQIWFHEMPAPLSLIGYVAETVYLRLLTHLPVITVSQSTKNDLMRHGFQPSNIKIISEGVHLPPLENLASVKKFDRPTVLSLGAMRSMKRTIHQIQAFEAAKQHMPNLQLKIAGDSSGKYGKKVLDYIRHSRYAADIEYLGKVSHEQKLELMRRSHVILQTAIKEGWGLTISEAAAQGTPAVVYDADGLRDSVRHGQTGLVTRPNPHALARGIINLLRDPELYTKLRIAAWRWIQELTFDKSYQDFKEAVGIL